jgi:CRP/FNR family transcriptional regulator, cyclic AMP receptor protein
VRRVSDVLGWLSRSYLFEGLTAEQLAPLAAVATTRAVVRGEYVCHLGDPAHELWVIASGEVKTSVTDADGVEVVHRVHGPGMTLGEPGFFAVERTRIVDVVATTPSVLVRLSRRELAGFLQQHPSVKDRALEGLASANRWQTTTISSLLSRSLTDRLLLRLLELVESSPERRAGLAATPKISQSTLAAMVGVSRENVNRALSALAAEGAIRQDSGRYLVLDEARLRRELARDWPLAQTRDRRLPAEVSPAP